MLQHPNGIIPPPFEPLTSDFDSDPQVPYFKTPSDVINGQEVFIYDLGAIGVDTKPSVPSVQPDNALDQHLLDLYKGGW